MMNRWLKLAAVSAVAFDFLTPGMGLIGGAFDYAVPQAKAAGLPANTVMVLSPNNTGNATTTMKMNGSGISNEFTPHYDGVALITISGAVANNTASDGATYEILFGTGTAPANAATLTGQACGAAVSTVQGAVTVPFSVTCVATGMTLNVGYWIDVGLAANVGGTATVTNVTVTAAEL